MSPLLRIVAAGVPLGILLAAGLSHLRRLRTLEANLAAHGLLRPALVQPASIALVAAEVLVGAGGIVAYFAGARAVAGRLLVAAALVFLAFAVYATIVLRVRPGATCGCAYADGPISALIPIRAVALGAVSLAAALDPVSMSDLESAYQQALSVMAICTLGVLASILPSVVGAPGISRLQAEGGPS